MTIRSFVAGRAVFVGLALVMAVSALAQMTAPKRLPDGGIDKAEGIGVVQQMGSQLPLGLTFTDSNGQTVQLSQFFGKRPVLLNFCYYRCKALCVLENEALVTSFVKLQQSEQNPLRLGRDVDVLTISIDPTETPAMALAKKQETASKFNYDISGGWHFLVGSKDAINALVTACGYHYTFDARDDLVNHPAALIIATPQGKVSKYMFGDDYPERPLAGAIQDAASNTVGTVADKKLFGCLSRDPLTGRYTVDVNRLVTICGCLWVVLVAISVVHMGLKYRTKLPFDLTGTGGGKA